MILEKKLFIGQQRKTLDEYLSLQLNILHVPMVNASFYNEDDNQCIYKMATISGTMCCIEMIRYLCVNNKGVKPWIVTKPINNKLDFNQLKEYSGDVIQFLSKQHPHVNYSGLVHIQTIISILTTMEYRK